MVTKSKKEIESEVREIFVKLMRGSKEEAREAKKQIEKLWHSDSRGFKKCASIALGYLSGFDQIENVDNQAAFVSGLGLFFLVLADDNFDTLKSFTLKLLQHPNGHVREAIRHAAEWLYCSLTSRAKPFVWPKGKSLTEKQTADQVQAEKQYLDFVKELEALIEKNDYHGRRAKYIQSMSPSVNKSLQMFWARLTDSPVYQRLISRDRPIPLDVSMKRIELHQVLSLVIEKGKYDFEVDDILDAIYNEAASGDFGEIISMFDRAEDMSELNDILQLLNAAWNYFPHKSLNGLSPVEMIARRGK